MAAKSRYQMVNRGRKGAPYWYVEDADMGNRCLYCSRKRGLALAYRDMLRRLARAAAARIAAGYHLPGL